MSGRQRARPGAKEAVVELGDAVIRAAVALQAIPADDEAAAYACLRDLDAALAGLAELLRSVPHVTRLGDPGPALNERLQRSQAELAAGQADLANYRVVLDELAELEKHRDETTAEARQLQDRVTELERLQRTAAEIPGLRVMADALEREVAALDAADVPEVDARLAAAVGQLAALTLSQRAVMSEAAADMARQAEAAAGELAELQAERDTSAAELARLEGDAALLAAERKETLPMLAAWAKADLDLADSLRTVVLGTGGTTLDSVRAELAGIGRRLTELDDVLGPVLAAHTEAYEQARQPRSL